MTSLGLERQVVDRGVYRRTVGRFRAAGIVLPSFAELAAPTGIPPAMRHALAGVKADAADPRNLFRVRWYSDRGRAGQAAGLLQMRRCGAVGDSDCAAVLFTGIQRRGE